MSAQQLQRKAAEKAAVEANLANIQATKEAMERNVSILHQIMCCSTSDILSNWFLSGVAVKHSFFLWPNKGGACRSSIARHKGFGPQSSPPGVRRNHRRICLRLNREPQMLK